MKSLSKPSPAFRTETIVHLFRKSLAVACMVLLTCVAVTAQTSKGILAGVVRDASGAALPDATVVVTNEATGESRTVSSGGTGAFRAEAINPGPYKVHVSHTGFSDFDAQHIEVAPSVVTTYDLMLQVGGQSQVITVEANSNAVNTENAQLAGNIATEELQKVPIFTLNPAELTSTLPGVTQQYATVQNLGGTGGNGSVKLTVNGARPRANNFLIDSQDDNDVSLGGEALQPTSPDFFQSVTVLLNDASAEFGRGGGAVINQITKAGTNQIHGSAYELYIGSGLDAIDGQTRRAKPAGTNLKSRYNQHEFGFTIGGPAWKDKLFGFGGADYTRYYGTAQPPAVELPDAAGYAQLQAIANAGNAQAQALLPYFNKGSYLTSSAFGTLQTQTELIPVSPRPGCTAGCSIETGFFQRLAVPQQAPNTQWTYRIDFIPRPSDTFSMHYLHNRGLTSPYYPLNPSTLPGFDSIVGGPSEFAGGNWVHVFTPHLLNEFRVSEVRLNFNFSPTAATAANPLSQRYNITFQSTGIGGNTGAPGILGVSQNMPQGRGEDQYQLQDTVGYTHGRQSFRIGFDIGRVLETDLVPQIAQGSEVFTSGGALSSIDNYLNDSLGTSGTATRTFGPTRTDPHLWRIAGFGQDDIKFSSDFTLNLGVRYDYLSNPLNSLSYPALDINNPFQAINTYVHEKDDKNNIAPRVGFAWVPRMGLLSDGKTVVHGGVGVFYDLFFSNILVNSAQSSPVAPTTTLTQGVNGCCAAASTLIASATPVYSANSSVQSVVSNLVNPLTYQYNFGFERELPFRLKATVNYVGSRGEKLYSNRQLNYVVNGARINPSRGVINVRDNRGDSNYNSLQTQLERRFAQGLFFRAAYTYGKLLDDTSEVFTTFASPTSYSANLAGNGLRQDYGPSAYDRRNVAVFTYSWTPIGFHSSNVAANAVLSALTRHFTIAGETQLYSGLYTSYNVSGRDINGDSSTTNDRPILSNPSASPNLVGVDGSYIGGISGMYYDQAAYNASPATARVRTIVQAGAVHFLVPNAANGAALIQQEVGRNSFANPGQQYWNVALEKAVPVPVPHLEQGKFIFRAEAQQLGNHNNLTYFTNNVNQVGTSGYQNISNAREANGQHIRLSARFQF